MQEQVLQEQEKAGDARNAKKREVEDEEKTKKENEHSFENCSTGCDPNSIVMTFMLQIKLSLASLSSCLLLIRVHLRFWREKRAQKKHGNEKSVQSVFVDKLPLAAHFWVFMNLTTGKTSQAITSLAILFGSTNHLFQVHNVNMGCHQG